MKTIKTTETIKKVIETYETIPDNNNISKKTFRDNINILSSIATIAGFIKSYIN